MDDRGSMVDALTAAVVAIGTIVTVVAAWTMLGWTIVDRPINGCDPQAVQFGDCTTSDVDGGRALIVALATIALVWATAAAAWLARSSPGQAPAPPPPTRRPAPPPPAPPRVVIPPRAVDRERMDALLVRCAEILDRRASSTPVDQISRQQLEIGLADIGCEPFDPCGEIFDSVSHRAVERITVHDAAADGRIMLTERLGWRQDDRLVRPADVVVGVLEPPPCRVPT